MMLARGATIIVVPENLAMFPLKLVGSSLPTPSIHFLGANDHVEHRQLGFVAQRGLGQLAAVFFIGEIFPPSS